MANNLQATVAPSIPAGTKSPLNLASPQALRSAKTLSPAHLQTLANDLNNIAAQVNGLNKAAQSDQSVTQIFVVNESGQVVAAFGNVEYEGVLWCNFLSELHAGTPIEPNNPNDAIFNANANGSVSIGNSGWLDVHDPFNNNAAWIGTQNDTLIITNAVNNGSGAIRLTVPAHPLATGNSCTVRNMNFYNVPNANGTRTVTVIDADTVDLDGSVWSAPYNPATGGFGFQPPVNPPKGIPTYQPTIDRVLQIIAASGNGSGEIRITTNVPHGYDTGDQVNIPAPGPIPGAVGQWVITTLPSNPNQFDLDGSTDAGEAFVPGGVALRYYAGILAEQFALGQSFQNYALRIFADGTVKIRGAIVSNSTLTGNVLQNATSTKGSGANVLTLTINNGTLTISGTGSFAGQGAITIDGLLTAAAAAINGLLSANAVSASAVDATTVDAAQYKIAGVPGLNQTIQFRNAAGTGVSSLTFTEGIPTAWTP